MRDAVTRACIHLPKDAAKAGKDDLEVVVGGDGIQLADKENLDTGARRGPGIPWTHKR